MTITTHPLDMSFGLWQTTVIDFEDPFLEQNIILHDRVIGSIRLWLGQENLEIKHVRLNAECRQRGFGAAWIQELSSFAVNLGYQALTLTAVEDGRFAWRRLGFRAKELTNESDRRRAIDQAQVVLEAAKNNGIRPLGPTDWRRWQRWKRQSLAREDLTVFDIHDWRLNDGRTISELLVEAIEANIFNDASNATLLSWEGTLDISNS